MVSNIDFAGNFCRAVLFCFQADRVGDNLTNTIQADLAGNEAMQGFFARNFQCKPAFLVLTTSSIQYYGFG